MTKTLRRRFLGVSCFFILCCLVQWRGRAEEVPLTEIRKLFARPASIPYPPGNQYTKERELLGKLLFFDPRLSGSHNISCATCHNPSLSWSDGLRRGVGHANKELGRRSPTILNLAWTSSFFWDGRAASLEEQALGPMFTPAEMHGNPEDIVKTVSELEGYRLLFAKAYPNEPISPASIAKAIATYERGIISGSAPFDKYIEGDEKALSPSAISGFKLFTTKARCVVCHSGWNFTDGSFHDIGLEGSDIGRGKFLPRVLSMGHAFKTPTLRNVAIRGPYMHDGSEPTLEAVIELYDLGGKSKRASLAPELKPLNLSKPEKADLIEFMKALTSLDHAVELPLLPR